MSTTEIEILKSQMDVLHARNQVLSETVNELLRANVEIKTGMNLSQTQLQRMSQEKDAEIAALKAQLPVQCDAPATVSEDAASV